MDEVKIKSQGKINPICCEIPIIRIYGHIDVTNLHSKQIMKPLHLHVSYNYTTMNFWQTIEIVLMKWVIPQCIY